MTELIMFYNVENLYLPDSESEVGQSSGLHHWDDYKYQLKIRKISNVFLYIKDDFGSLPSLIGLAEIGAGEVLDHLTAENSAVHGYGIIYRQSPDPRRLSVALLFDKTKYTLLRHEMLQFRMAESPEFDTRDILHAELLSGGKKIHVFVCHLPSKRERDVKKVQRDYILHKLSETIQELTDKEEPVILMGDFNENPDTKVMQQFLVNKNGSKMLSNPFESLYHKSQFSTYHGKLGVGFDQILYSEDSLLETLNLNNISAEIYNASRLRNKDRKNSNYPLRTYSGTRYIGGWSDHFPVLIKLTHSIGS